MKFRSDKEKWGEDFLKKAPFDFSDPIVASVLEVLAAEPQLTNTAQAYAERPAYRPLTKFENRGLRLGHGVWDLVFRKN